MLKCIMLGIDDVCKQKSYKDGARAVEVKQIVYEKYFDKALPFH